MNRRAFVKTTAMAGAGLAFMKSARMAWAFSQSSGLRLTLFGQPFRGVGPGGIPVALPDPTPAPVTGALHYSLKIGQFADMLHPNLGPTTLWGYSPAVALAEGPYPTRHLGGIIVAEKGVPIQLTFTNNLPPNHILPVDTSAFFPDASSAFGRHNNAMNAACTHLHGGFVPWISDGGPMSWFTPDGGYGPSAQSGSFNIYKLLNPNLNPGQAEIYYPNQQSARMMWYHDHAHDITRLNAYAGIATAYIIRDAFELNLQNQGLPGYVEAGGREIPIVIQDKIFVNAATIGTTDPVWTSLPVPQTTGSLWYAHNYEASRWGPIPKGMLPIPDPSCIPEYFGDTMLANGTVYPQATVEARRYRIRLLNACQARFLNLQMYVDDGSPNGITLDSQGNPTNTPFLNAAAPNPSGRPTARWFVLGTEGGFLPKPAVVASNVPFGGLGVGSLFAAPAERYDLLVDFTGYAGKNMVLYSDAPAPFPMGDPRNDYFPGFNVNKNPTNGTTVPGQGPNTRVIMRFKVVAATSADARLAITAATDLTTGNDPLPVPQKVTTPPPGVFVRPLTLNETFDNWGRLIQMLGTNTQVTPGTYGQEYMMDSTENVGAGTTEVWQIANLTGDTHPIHFHLVNVQIISRQPFDAKKYNGVPIFTGPPVPPGPEESGWKDTVRMNPGEVTTVIMQFKLPTVPFSVPTSPRTGGNEYVWHCHILEHEEHDMMRPLVVT